MYVLPEAVKELPSDAHGLKFRLGKCYLNKDKRLNCHYDTTAIVLRRITRKLYICPHCNKGIELNTFHALVSLPGLPVYMNHTHLHLECARKAALKHGYDFETTDPTMSYAQLTSRKHPARKT